ncbi:MAG: putative Fe-S oxidoreductase [Verrucomicrobiales bacterium]|nr:putative Fe-S oxidoreductase [Verrucomicrobiales bacterium]
MFNSGIKVRPGPDGIHLFDRNSGTNLLIEEIAPVDSMWAKAPRQVSIALTNTCDLACKYCYAPKTRAILDYDRIVSWLHELDSNGTIGVGFGGGEPTLYPRFAEICSYACRNTGLAVTFTTHGHHLDATLLTALKGNVHFVRLSMDGIGSTYERLRGRSFHSFSQRVQAIKTITPFGINYVVNSDTLPDIDAAAIFAEKSGASEFLLLPEQPTNGCAGITESTSRGLQQWVEHYSGRMRLAVSEIGADGLPTCNPFVNEVGLHAYMHIDANGVLKPNSYAERGVPIGPTGVLSALADLRQNQTRL